ncbi:MAG: GNAT family N-acetyltransferase [Candidatus Handelsmanbacteria bacterium]|nr:GNAT family N-acetyltransferase [Candidatus Handelsmanbacteria bacterium]
MSDTLEIHPVSDPRTWDEFVRRAVGGTVFSTWAWLECARQATGQPFRCLGVYRNGQLVAGLSGVEGRRAGLRRLGTPVLTPHGGLLLAPVEGKGPAEAEWNQPAELLVAYLQRAYHHCALSHAPAVGDLRPFTWAGWEARVRYTYQLDLGRPERVWAGFEHRTRKAIAKAEREGVVVEPTADLELFRRQYELLYARQGGRAPVDAGVAQHFVAAAFGAGLAAGLAARSPEGEVAAVVIFVRGAEGVYAWVSGADPELSHTGAASLIQWRYFAANSGQRFDFTGANIPGIALFKRGFGGRLVPYFATEGFSSRWMRGLFSGARVLRNL